MARSARGGGKYYQTQANYVEEKREEGRCKGEEEFNLFPTPEREFHSSRPELVNPADFHDEARLSKEKGRI